MSYPSLSPVSPAILELHADFAECLEKLLRSLIEDGKLKCQSVTSRAKDEESLRSKLERKLEQGVQPAELRLDDLAGVRVLLYFKSDVQRIVDLLRREFHVLGEENVEKRYPDCHQSLGYCARHFIVSLDDCRKHFAEYRRFRSLRCEVQVTTVLEHAWAEVEHDLYYKHEESAYDSDLGALEREFASIVSFIRHGDERIDKLGVLFNRKARSSHPESAFLTTVRRTVSGHGA